MRALSGIARSAVWRWADQLVFWGVNVGLVGFVIGLSAEVAEVKRVSTPVMGVSILLALLTAAVRMSAGGRRGPADAEAPQAS